MGSNVGYETGSATDWDDLLDKLETFLTTDTDLVAAGQEWTVNDDSGTTPREIYFQGPGLAGNDEIYVNIEKYYYAATVAYNWEIRGATGYDGGQAFEDQPGISPPSYFCLSNSTMTYWFYANGRRFTVIAKIGTVFTSMHGGLMYPYALPSEYPYPLFIGSTSYSIGRLYSDTGLQSVAFWKMGHRNNYDQSATYLRMPDGYWLTGAQYTTGSYGDRNFHIWPYFNAFTSGTNDGGVLPYTENLDGTYTLLPMILYSNSYGNMDIYGELDGCYFIPGTNLNSEDTITIGADTYDVFQCINRVGRNDFAAIVR